MKTQDAPETPDSPAWAARKLVRAARAGTLATAIEGQPFASLVTPATAPDGSILLLLSDLSEHTRHLRADGRCAVMVQGEPDSPNPQTAPRVTVTGIAAIEPAWKSRWVAIHPYAEFYAGFGDFNLWRLQPAGGLFVGGFARAHRLRQADLMVEAPEIAAAEAGLISQCNGEQAAALDTLAASHGWPGAGWRMVACDGDGFDLALGDAVRRIAWSAPVDGPGAIRDALAALTVAAPAPGSS
jgi:putative heme iron utilization protein